MIKQIFDGIDEYITDSYYGKKIMAAYLAYGAGYDFCRFYSCGEGIIHIYNSDMVIDGNVDFEDIELFVELTKPVTIEVSGENALQDATQYVKRHRTLFHGKNGTFNVDANCVNVNSFTLECYDILKQSFENICGYDMWYVDISHRIRHNVAELYLYRQTTITRQFNIDSFSFLSHIATADASRGNGTARNLLYYLVDKFKAEGTEVYLWSLDYRKSFYESIGFEPVAEDILYEMKG